MNTKRITPLALALVMTMLLAAYDGKRYKAVTDDNMYAEPISGYIEKQ